MIAQPYFVWRRGLRGPVPEVRCQHHFGRTPGECTLEEQSILARFPITQAEFERADFFDLAQRFPAPQEVYG